MNPTEDTPNYLKDLADRSNRQRSLNEAEDTPTPDTFHARNHPEPCADHPRVQDDTLKHYTNKAAKDYGKFKDAEVMDAMLPKQDDKQLEIRKLLEEYRIPRHSEDREWVDLFVEKFEALFTTAQLQLVSELEGKVNNLEVDIEATEKHIESTGLTGDELERRVLDMQVEADDRHDVLSDVTTLLKHKKQELERLQ